MVVPHQGNHTTVRGSSCRVGVLKRITTAVNPGTLAVPDSEHAIDLGTWIEIHVLSAPHSGRREVFVDARLEPDVERRQAIADAPEFAVVAT